MPRTRDEEVRAVTAELDRLLPELAETVAALRAVLHAEPAAAGDDGKAGVP